MIKTKSKKRAIKADDICRLELINSVALAPDEKRIAYTVETVDRDKRKYYSRLFVADCQSGETRQYTFGEISDRSPIWSPDGKQIAFISTREKKTGIYVIPTEGGAERKIIEEDGSFSGLVWTPDSRNLVYCFQYHDSHTVEDEKKKKEAPLYRHITRLMYRFDGLGFLHRDHYHIYKVCLETGDKKQLTKGKYDEYMPDVSPDGKQIVFTSNRHRDPDINRVYFDLFLIPIDGGKEKKLPLPPGFKIAPRFSPDGKMIAYIGNDRPEENWGVTNNHVWVVGKNNRPATKNLIPKFDRTCFDLTISDLGEGSWTNPLYWSNDGKRVYFSASDTGCTHIFYAPVKGGKPTRVTHKKCHIKAFGMNGKGKNAAAVYSDLKTPADLHLIPAVYHGDKKSIRPVRTNRELLTELNLPRVKEIWFRGHDSFELQGWLVTPPKLNSKRKYPAILEIHGGPVVQYGFTFFHEMLYLASRGYVIFYTNPRGGGGRGELFAEASQGSWGEIDYMDCMSAADWMEKQPFINRNRIGVTGGSYGGFMTNWMVGHTNRFRAAVTQRSVVNLESFFGSSDMGYALHRRFDGTPWSNPENYKKCSPLTYARKIKTPLLIIHSENDGRVSIEQAEQLFATLKMMRKKVEMIRFPEESHGLSRHGRPDRRIARLDWIVKWFDKYLK